MRFSILLTLGFVLTGCGETAKKGGAPPALPVNVAKPIARTIAPIDVFTGRFTATERVEVRARVSGYLESVEFEESKPIAEDTPMFRLDARPFQALVDSAEANLTSATAARDLAKASYERFVEAAGKKTQAVSRLELDQRESQLAQAEAEVLAAEAARKSAALDLEFATISAPISGIAGQVAVTRGNYISGGSPTSTLLTTVVPHDPIYCYFEVDEQRVLKFTRLFMEGKAPGREDEPYRVKVAVSDSDEFEFEGVIAGADNELDAGTATMRVRALVPNPDGFLTPGLFARVQVPGGPPESVLLVQDAALGFDQSTRFAWVLGADNAVERRLVEVGRLEGMFRVVTGGLDADDTIVLTNLQMLRPGSVVAPAEVPMDPTEAETSSPVSQENGAQAE